MYDCVNTSIAYTHSWYLVNTDVTDKWFSCITNKRIFEIKLFVISNNWPSNSFCLRDIVVLSQKFPQQTHNGCCNFSVTLRHFFSSSASTYPAIQHARLIRNRVAAGEFGSPVTLNNQMCIRDRFTPAEAGPSRTVVDTTPRTNGNSDNNNKKKNTSNEGRR